MVFGLTFKGLIHFEVIVVCCIRRWFCFIFLHVSNFPNSIYWINYLNLIVSACFLCRILMDYKGVGLFLVPLFRSIDLGVCCYAITMLFWLLLALWYSLILGSIIPPTLFFCLSITVVKWGLLWCHINFWNIYSSSVKYIIGILIGFALNLELVLVSMNILMMLILPTHEQGMCYHLFVSSSISFFSVL